MSELDLFFHGALARVELDRRRTSIEPWPEPLREEARRSIVGGAAAAAALGFMYGDALILATGPLTGSLAPGSGMLVASCSKPGEKLVHLPLLPCHGLSLKASGVDFVVITGTAPESMVLGIAGGAAHIEPSNGLEKLDVPGMREALMGRRPDYRQSMILCGPAGRNGSPCAAAGLEVGASLDRGALAGWMARHQLSAVVLAGAGSLPKMGMDRSLLQSLQAELGLGGFMSILERAGGGSMAGAHAARILGRPAACYLCPKPCLAYLKPGKSSRAGLLCMDHAGFAAMSEACSGSIARALPACARLGLDPVAAAPLLRGVPDEKIDACLTELASGEAHDPAGKMSAPIAERSAEWPVPVWPYADAVERLAAGLVLGVCPLLMQRCPEIPLERWLAGIEGEDGAVTLRDKLRGSLLTAGLGVKSGRQSDAE